MDDFDDLLEAFDGVMDGSHQRAQPRQQQNFRNGAIDDGARLPRLYTRSSSELATETCLNKIPRTHSKRRRMLHGPRPQGSPPVSRNPTPHLEVERALYCQQEDDPLDLMLRSKKQQRPGLEGLESGYATEPGDDDYDLNDRDVTANIDGGGPGAVAGVFRLTHARTGFVHYGYSWDVAGAKADQLRQLRIESEADATTTGGGAHPHRGLSAVVRGQHERQWFGVRDGSSTERHRSSRPLVVAGMPQIRFEVVRLVPLPTRFRAADFEREMREACARELMSRRTHLLVLAARQYQMKHVGPAFRRIYANCEMEKGDEQCAAAVEVQRVWRGGQARHSVRRDREAESRGGLEVERTRAGAILAVWAQAKHRGDAGRRRANQRRDERSAEAAARRKQASTVAAVTIQRWVRSIYHERKAAAAAAEEASVGALLDVIRLEEEAKEPRSTGIPWRGPPRPISASEARVAIDPADVDTTASLSEASGMGYISPPRRRPSSSREFRPRSITISQDDASDAQREYQDPPPRKQRERRRPSSAPRSNRTSGIRYPEGAVGPVTSASLVPDTLSDASRLVLEGNPGFTAATAIQAAWRGFITRLGARKRQRAAMALRRKREGKWRKQRGVVGKRVSVAWDERKDFEGGRGDGERGVVSCIEIQVTT